jgi:hypothetical protein
MADTSLLAPNFDLGFQRDTARDQMERGAAWDMVDYIPRDGGELRKRGGWGLGSTDLNALSASTRLSALAWAPYSTNPRLLMVSDTHRLFEAIGPIDGTAGTSVGDVVVVPTYPPFWHKDRVVLPVGLADGGSIDPRKYDGTTIAAIPNTPPRARVGWSWGDYLILANGYDPSSSYALRRNRLWVSNPGDPDTFNTSASGGIWDMPDEVVGGLATRTTNIVFGYSKVWVLIGDTPPPGSNWVRRDLFSTGCMDGRSIATWRDFFIWANNAGVWQSDGATLTDLTLRGGISTYWRSLVSGFNLGNGWKAAGGILFGEYWITITNASGTNVATLVCNLDTQTWRRVANVPTMMYAQRVAGPGTTNEAGSEELFFAWYSGARAGRLSGVWTPSSGNAYDGDGTAVLPVLETPYFRMGATQQKRWRRVYANYDLRSAGGSPTIAVGVAMHPNDTGYAEVGSLPATTAYTRRPVDVRRRSEGMAFRMRQTDASADTSLGPLEAEGHIGEGSR